MTRPRADLTSVTTGVVVGGALASSVAASGSALTGLGALLVRNPNLAFWLVTPVNLLLLHIPFLNIIYAFLLPFAILPLVWMARGLVMGFVFACITAAAMVPFIFFGMIWWAQPENQQNGALAISVAHIAALHWWLRYVCMNNRAYDRAVESLRKKTGKAFPEEHGIRSFGAAARVLLIDDASRTIAFVSKDEATPIELGSISAIGFQTNAESDDVIEFYGVGPTNQTVRVRLLAGAEALANALESKRVARSGTSSPAQRPVG